MGGESAEWVWGSYEGLGTYMIGASEPRITSDGAVQLVTFLVGEEVYGIDINAITEVVRPMKITPLPHMPAFIEGVINLRGGIIPVVDLRKRFGLSHEQALSRKTRMLITRGGARASARSHGELLGLIVDGVQEVLYVSLSDIAPAPAAATGARTDFITGMAKTGGHLVIVLNIGGILSQQERTALAEAGNG